MVRTLWTKFDRDWGWNLARMLAYACLTALFSVVGLQLGILSLILRIASDTTEQRFIGQFMWFLPDRVTGSAVLSFADALERAPWPLILVGLVVALWYGTRFFVVMESCLCIIFRRPKRPFREQNLTALWMLALFAVLFPIIVLSATVTPHVPIALPHADASTRVAAATGRMLSSPLYGTLALLGGFGANFSFLLIAYTLLTPGRVSARAAAPGAAIAALLAQGFLFSFPIYVHVVLQPSHFGTVAGFVLVALVFFFAYAVLVVLGAELASVRAGYQPTRNDVTNLLSDLHTSITEQGVNPAPVGPSVDLQNATSPLSATTQPAMPIPHR
jgi:uncharacterized BrkB/YihY/UPF0761 family membrane protein